MSINPRDYGERNLTARETTVFVIGAVSSPARKAAPRLSSWYIVSVVDLTGKVLLSSALLDGESTSKSAGGEEVGGDEHWSHLTGDEEDISGGLEGGMEEVGVPWLSWFP